LKAPSGSAKSPKEKTWSRTWDWGKSGSKSKDSKDKWWHGSKDSKHKDGKFSFKRRSPDPKDAAPGAQCPNLSKNEDPETKEKLNPYVPKPTFCQLKRATSYLKFEPNFPEGRPDVYIEVIADGEIFQLFPDDYEGEAPGPFYVYEGDSTKEGQLFLGMDSKEFITLYNEQEKMGGTGFQFRFVSKNGPGEWNSCSYSPIAFDLNGNGVVEHITSPEGWEIDITGNGDMEHLAEWFAPDEGILIDAHTEIVDGAVSGAHMMGDMGGKYTDGFAKLATYDTDCDNKISGKELENFRIWKDANSNAKLDEGELYKLSDFGIVSLSTIHDNLRSHAELKDGSSMMMEDLWFDPFERRRRLQAARDNGFDV
jgi:hypothetical protein